jgi:hypothetical protein
MRKKKKSNKDCKCCKKLLIVAAAIVLVAVTMLVTCLIKNAVDKPVNPEGILYYRTSTINIGNAEEDGVYKNILYRNGLIVKEHDGVAIEKRIADNDRMSTIKRCVSRIGKADTKLVEEWDRFEEQYGSYIYSDNLKQWITIVEQDGYAKRHYESEKPNQCQWIIATMIDELDEDFYQQSISGEDYDWIRE